MGSFSLPIEKARGPKEKGHRLVASVVTRSRSRVRWTLVNAYDTFSPITHHDESRCMIQVKKTGMARGADHDYLGIAEQHSESPAVGPIANQQGVGRMSGAASVCGLLAQVPSLPEWS